MTHKLSILKKFIYLVILSFYILSCNSQNLSNKEKAKIINNELIDFLINWSVNKTDTSKINIDNSITLINRAIELDSSNSILYNTKIEILKLLNRYEEIMGVYNNLLRIKPNFFEGYFSKGLICENYNKVDSAKEAFLEAKKILLLRTDDTSDYKKLSLIQLTYLINRDKFKLSTDLRELKLTDSGITRLRDDMVNNMKEHPNSVGVKYLFDSVN